MPGHPSQYPLSEEGRRPRRSNKNLFGGSSRGNQNAEETPGCASVRRGVEAPVPKCRNAKIQKMSKFKNAKTAAPNGGCGKARGKQREKCQNAQNAPTGCGCTK